MVGINVSDIKGPILITMTCRVAGLGCTDCVASPNAPAVLVRVAAVVQSAKGLGEHGYRSKGVAINQ